MVWSESKPQNRLARGHDGGREHVVVVLHQRDHFHDQQVVGPAQFSSCAWSCSRNGAKLFEQVVDQDSHVSDQSAPFGQQENEHRIHSLVTKHAVQSLLAQSRMVPQIEYGVEPRSTLFQTAQRKRRIRQRGCYAPTCGLQPRRFGALVVPLSPDESGVAQGTNEAMFARRVSRAGLSLSAFGRAASSVPQSCTSAGVSRAPAARARASSGAEETIIRKAV